jgi:hypothetical protein
MVKILWVVGSVDGFKCVNILDKYAHNTFLSLNILTQNMIVAGYTIVNKNKQ